MITLNAGDEVVERRALANSVCSIFEFNGLKLLQRTEDPESRGGVSEARRSLSRTGARELLKVMGCYIRAGLKVETERSEVLVLLWIAIQL